MNDYNKTILTLSDISFFSELWLAENYNDPYGEIRKLNYAIFLSYGIKKKHGHPLGGTGWFVKPHLSKSCSYFQINNIISKILIKQQNHPNLHIIGVYLPANKPHNTAYEDSLEILHNEISKIRMLSENFLVIGDINGDPIRNHSQNDKTLMKFLTINGLDVINISSNNYKIDSYLSNQGSGWLDHVISHQDFCPQITDIHYDIEYKPKNILVKDHHPSVRKYLELPWDPNNLSDHRPLMITVDVSIDNTKYVNVKNKTPKLSIKWND